MGLIFARRRLLRKRKELKREVWLLKGKLAKREREGGEYSPRGEKESRMERALVKALAKLTVYYQNAYT